MKTFLTKIRRAKTFSQKKRNFKFEFFKKAYSEGQKVMGKVTLVFIKKKRYIKQPNF